MHNAGKVIVAVGVLLIGIGLLFQFNNLGRLPGDVVVRRKNFTLYFPLATSLLVSLALTLVFWLLRRR